MSEEVAKQVVIGIALAGAVAWLWSVIFLIKSARIVQSSPRDEWTEPAPPNLLTGSVHVEGGPKALTAAMATLLAQGALGPLRIVEKTDSRIVFDKLATLTPSQTPGLWFQRGEMRFRPLGQKQCQVDWAVEPSKLRRLLWVGYVIQGTGLLALLAGSWAMVTFIASSPDPAIRWQSLQMLQVLHLLWPPFLFGTLFRKAVRGIRAQLEATATNLPYLV